MSESFVIQAMLMLLPAVKPVEVQRSARGKLYCKVDSSGILPAEWVPGFFAEAILVWT